MEIINASIKIKVPVVHCSRLAPAECQAPTRAALLLSSATGQGRDNKMKHSLI